MNGDPPDELYGLAEFQRRATGRILINGLGQGIAARMAFEKLDVLRVEVVEVDKSVIDFVRLWMIEGVPGYGKVIFHHADAYTWRAPTGQRWNVVWHDVWDTVSADNLEGMKRLHWRYGHRCDWQGSWCRADCERAAKRRV